MDPDALRTAVDALASTFPQVEIVMFGTEEPRSNIHVPNESVDLEEQRRMILTEVLLMARLDRA